MNSFVDYLLELGPGWLTETYTGEQYQRAIGEALDGVLPPYTEAIIIKIISKADAPALALLGSERGIKAYPGEALETYRARVQGAWEFWRWAGTNKGILLVLTQLGYKAQIIEHFRAHPDRWAEFSIDIAPIVLNYSPTRYNSPTARYNNPNSRYNTRLDTNEIDKIRGLINEVKAAHSKLIKLQYRLKLPARYNQPTARYNNPLTVYTVSNVYTIDL